MAMAASEIETLIKRRVSRRGRHDHGSCRRQRSLCRHGHEWRLQGQDARPAAPDGLRRAQGPHGRRASRAVVADRGEGLIVAGVHVMYRYVDAWRRGDLVALLACYHDEITLHYFGDNPMAGDHVGREASLAAFREISLKTNRRLIEITDVHGRPEALRRAGPRGVQPRRAGRGDRPRADLRDQGRAACTNAGSTIPIRPVWTSS